MKYYLVDETNVTFQPQNAKEAIILWNRIRKSGINNWDDVPSILQHCARTLPPKEHDAFADFICQPAGHFESAKPSEDYFPALRNVHPDEEKEGLPDPVPCSSDQQSPLHNTDSGSASCTDSGCISLSESTPVDRPAA